MTNREEERGQEEEEAPEEEEVKSGEGKGDIGEWGGGGGRVQRREKPPAFSWRTATG